MSLSVFFFLVFNFRLPIHKTKIFIPSLLRVVSRRQSRSRPSSAWSSAQSFCVTFSAGRVFHFIAGAWDFFTSWFCTDYSAKTGGNCDLGTSYPEKVRHDDKLTSYVTTFQCRNELSSPLKRLSVISVIAVVKVYRNSVHDVLLHLQACSVICSQHRDALIYFNGTQFDF